MYDFSSYIRISLELSSLRTLMARDTRSFKGFQRCERTLRAPRRFRLSWRQRRMCENMRSSSFLACHSFAPGSAVRTFTLSLASLQSELSNGDRHPASIDEKKNRMRRHTIFCRYCRYYGHYYYSITTVVMTVTTRHGIMTSNYPTWYNNVVIPCRVAAIVTTVSALLQCHAIVVTTVVTTVAMENRITTHAIFFSSTDARCREPIFFKNRVYFAHKVVSTSVQ